jgi:hypothetical protein
MEHPRALGSSSSRVALVAEDELEAVFVGPHADHQQPAPPQTAAGGTSHLNATSPRQGEGLQPGESEQVLWEGQAQTSMISDSLRSVCLPMSATYLSVIF